MSLQPQLKPRTQKEFFAWEGHCDGRYEFDGERPVDMNGMTVDHAIISRTLHRLLDLHLRDTSYRALGPEVGLETTRTAVRYPDAMVTAARPAGSAYMVPDVVVVFEILSPTSGRTDRHWMTTALMEPSETIRLPEIGIEIALAALYEDADFADTPPEA